MMKDVESEDEGGLRRTAGDHRAGKIADGHRKAIDFIVRREFDYQIANYAKGTPLSELPGVSYPQGRRHRAQSGRRASIENLDELPWVTKVYKRDLDFKRYNVPFLLNPFISFYTTRGCPAMCTFCLWPQTHSGHRWRLRSADDIASEVQYTLEEFPGLKEIFFDDDTFNYRKARTIELCEEAEAAELHLVAAPRASPPITTR